MAGNFKTVKLLVEKGANVNAKYEGANPLYFAAMNSHNKVIKYLIEKGSEVNILFDRIYPILFHPCKECQKETIEILMKNKADANIIMGNLTMAGLVAFNENKNCSLKKKEETLRMMIKYGADINIIAPPGINALDMAIMQNNADIEKMLIKLGAKSNQAIGMHAVANNKEMILFLLENGFDINAKNSYGETALDQKITDEIKQFLISHGAKSGKDLK